MGSRAEGLELRLKQLSPLYIGAKMEENVTNLESLIRIGDIGEEKSICVRT